MLTEPMLVRQCLSSVILARNLLVVALFRPASKLILWSDRFFLTTCSILETCCPSLSYDLVCDTTVLLEGSLAQNVCEFYLEVVGKSDFPSNPG